MNIQGQRILIFGDSLSHHGADNAPQIWDVDQNSSRSSNAPGDLLASMLYERGAVVRVDAKVGRSANNFWTTEQAAQLIASDQQFAPTFVLVMLGTNDLGITMSIDQASIVKIRDAFKTLPKPPQIWAVGPPTFANLVWTQQAADVYGMLVNVFGADRVIDAQQLTTTANRTADGVHFSPIGAQAFAGKLLTALQSIPDPSTVIAPAGMKPIWKAAIAVAGFGAVAGIGWFVYHKVTGGRAALGDSGEGEEEEGGWDDGYVPTKRDMKGVKPELIARVTHMVSRRMSVEDIHDMMIAQGNDEEDVYVAYRIAQNKHQHYDMSGFGMLGGKQLGSGDIEPVGPGTAYKNTYEYFQHVYSIGQDAIQAGEYDKAVKIAKEGTAHSDETAKKNAHVAFSPLHFWSVNPKHSKKLMTYPEASRSIQTDLAAHGWTVSRGLKIQHATSPDGQTRLWFKPQTIWYTSAQDRTLGPAHNYKDARAIMYSLDMRMLPGPRFRYWWTTSKPR